MLRVLWQWPKRVFYGWWVVAAGSVVYALSGGLTIYREYADFLGWLWLWQFEK